MTTSRSAAAVETRERIVNAASRLLAAGGRYAVSTRAVSAAAGVQAPTIYRLFRDKQGLLDAVAMHGLTSYLASKTDRQPGPDPVDDLRAGWDLHISFGLANPALYSLIYGEPRIGSSPAAIAGAEILAAHIHHIAEAGRLRLDEQRAAKLVHAAGSGTTLTLISLTAERRDLSLSELAREAVITAITTEVPTSTASGPITAAIALRAALPQIAALSAHERGLLREWLDRIVTS